MNIALTERRSIALPHFFSQISRGSWLQPLLTTLIIPVYMATAVGALQMSRLYTMASRSAYIPTAKPVTTQHAPQAQSVQTQPTTPTPAVQAAAQTNDSVPSCTRAQLAKPSGAALQTPGLNQRIETPHYYQVYGRTVDQLRNQLRSCAPNGYFAATNYSMNWAYQSIRRGDVCEITNVRVGIHIIVQYPTWSKDAYTSPATEQRWNSMMHSLIAHEQGHVIRSVQVAQQLTNALSTMPPIACDQFTQHVVALTAQYTSVLTSENNQYDAVTNHGQSQGAQL